jgi:NAD(P)-dependent dehydrogenase (short-subunit alcohol dehydrogenase family)
MNVMKMFDLTDQVAVITGAGSGLGYVFAEAMAEAGAHVVCGDIDKKW